MQCSVFRSGPRYWSFRGPFMKHFTTILCLKLTSTLLRTLFTHGTCFSQPSSMLWSPRTLSFNLCQRSMTHFKISLRKSRSSPNNYLSSEKYALKIPRQTGSPTGNISKTKGLTISCVPSTRNLTVCTWVLGKLFSASFA